MRDGDKAGRMAEGRPEKGLRYSAASILRDKDGFPLRGRLAKWTATATSGTPPDRFSSPL